jgi:transposase InsO family protein
MPWKETVVTDERVRFVLACRESGGARDSVSVLCRRFGVSRKTGYKWLGRYEALGPAGLRDRGRAPHAHPNSVPEAVRESVLSLRRAHPTWGPRKLLAALSRERPGLPWPAASTAGELLRRHGLSVPRRRRARAAPGANPLGDCVAPNRVWCADFKGHFRTGDGTRCDPLTVMDGHSRYLLRCVAARPDFGSARGVFEAAFRQYGLPEAIRTDNGQPFAGVGVAGLSRLSAWWVRLGIILQRIEPGCPQQNGRHERMHGTLKRETADPPARTLSRQQGRFDAFVREYNRDRPHEALGMATPASAYEPSPRAYPERLPELEYPAGSRLRKVDGDGDVRWNVSKVFVGRALAGQVLGLQGLDGRLWLVRFGPLDLGLLDQRLGRLLRPHERRRLGL